MADPTLQEFVSSYWNEKWLDVSSIVQDESLWATVEQPNPMMQQEEMPLPDFRSHIEKMKPMLMQMTEWEMMSFIFDLIWEYTVMSQQWLESDSEESEFLSNY